MTSRQYESPAAFKEALEHRIRARTPKDAIVARTRQLLVFDRFLARIAAVFGEAATLKGGVALELRIELPTRFRVLAVAHAHRRPFYWRERL